MGDGSDREFLEGLYADKPKESRSECPSGMTKREFVI